MKKKNNITIKNKKKKVVKRKKANKKKKNKMYYLRLAAKVENILKDYDKRVALFEKELEEAFRYDKKSMCICFRTR